MIGKTLIALVLAATPAAGTFPDVGEPLAAEAHVEDLHAAEHENGLLPADLLVEVEPAPGCLLETEAAESWALLAAHAAADEVQFVARWCYRSLAAQHRTYDRNCPLIDSVPEVSTAEQEAADEALPSPPPAVTRRVCNPPTAKPGNSNHGWGRAVDIKAGGRLLACDSPEFEWLSEKARRYGWVHPEWAACGADKQEPWHWEWGGTMEPPPPPPRFIQSNYFRS